MNLPGWDDKNRVPGGCEFDKFWGFIWELQTAIFFADQLGLNVEWKRTGPDIRVWIDSTSFFVECYTYRKSFGLKEFIDELFRCICSQIMTEYVPFMQFSLPKDTKIEKFLDELFTPYLDPSFYLRK